MEYTAQRARDAQEMGYGDRCYWDYLERSTIEHADKFMLRGDPVTARKMVTQSLSDALAGNEGY